MAPEVKLLSLKLLGGSENTILAYVSPASNECRTFVDFSSCVIDSVDSRNSRARTLVSDLAEKEVRTYTCVAQTWKLLGDTQTHTWSVLLEGPRKFLSLSRLLTKTQNRIILKVRSLPRESENETGRRRDGGKKRNFYCKKYL